jgi:hypothetical protein
LPPNVITPMNTRPTAAPNTPRATAQPIRTQNSRFWVTGGSPVGPDDMLTTRTSAELSSATATATDNTADRLDQLPGPFEEPRLGTSPPPPAGSQMSDTIGDTVLDQGVLKVNSWRAHLSVIRTPAAHISGASVGSRNRRWVLTDLVRPGPAGHHPTGVNCAR